MEGLGLGLEVAEPVASPPCFCRQRLLRLRGNRGFAPASGSQLVAAQPRKGDAPQRSERRDERRDLLESKLSRAPAVGEQRGDPLDKSHRRRRHLVNLFSKSPGGRLVITVCPQNL